MKSYERSSSFKLEDSYEDICQTDKEELKYKFLQHLKENTLQKSSASRKHNCDSLWTAIEEIEYISKSSFEYFSKDFQKWASHRLKIVKILKEEAEKLETIRKYATEGRFLSSCLDIAGTVGAVVLRNIQPQWETKAAAVSLACSSIGLISSIAEVTMSQRAIEDVKKSLREDHQTFKKMLKWFQNSTLLDRKIQNIFHIDVGLVKRIQNDHGIILDTKEKQDKLIMKLGNVLEKISSEFYDDADDNAWRKMLYSAILLSNGKQDPDILEDENFLIKTKIFSSSVAAQIWWNKIKFQDEFLESKYISKSDLMSEINSLKKDDSIFDHTVPLCLPFLRHSSVPSSSIILLNSLAAYSNYSELSQDLKYKASRTLKEIAENLKSEFDYLNKIYDIMNPNSEYNKSQISKRISA